MSKLGTCWACALLALSAVFGAGAAQAQSGVGSLTQAQNAAPDIFARDRSVPVRERPRPGYEARGLPVGTFTAFPTLQIDLEHNDNIYATRTGAESDWIVRVKPEVQLESGWSRHALGAYVRANIARHQDFESENFEDWGVGASGRLDVTRGSNIVAGVDHAKLTEPRTSSNTPGFAREPVEYEYDAAFLAASRVSGRVKLSARADVREFDYQNAISTTGAVIQQGDRDRTVTSFTGRADYAVSPATALFVQATSNSRDYRIAASPTLPARDSDGYEILAGANFELGAVARGEIAAGYIDQKFDSAVYGEIDGVGARAKVEWFPTQLTTVTGVVSRTIEDAGISGSGGYLSTASGLRVDHELMRNVLLNFDVSVSRDDYEGIDRNDDRVQASVGGTYLLNRNVGVSLAAGRFEQKSKGAARGVDFDVNRVTLSLVLQF